MVSVAAEPLNNKRTALVGLLPAWRPCHAVSAQPPTFVVTTPARAEAAAALLAALRDVAEANDRLQMAAAWVLEAFGDQLDAETVRMLRVPGGPDRPGPPPVPARARSEHVTDQLAPADPTSIRHGDESGRER